MNMVQVSVYDLMNIEGGQGHYRNGRFVSASRSANGRPYNADSIAANRIQANNTLRKMVIGASTAAAVAGAITKSPVVLAVGAVTAVARMLTD